MSVQSISNDTYMIEKPAHKLKHEWVLWYHPTSNPDWSIKSYTKVCDFKNIEDVIIILKLIPDYIICNCYFFIMKKNIDPIIEHEKNRNGGYFKYRITNKYVYDTWKYLTYALTGGTISKNKLFLEQVNGISISPKKNFCVIKIWMKRCDFQNPELITNEIKYLIPNTALFTIHKPEF